MNHVHTVTGLLSPHRVTGPVLTHEHLALDLRRDSDQEAVLSGIHHSAVTAELVGLREEFGLSLVVEQTCRGMGRDAAALARISRRSQVAVVASTGWYYEPFHLAEVAAAGVEELTEILLTEIEGGLDATGMRPGLIGEVGSHGERPSEPERRTLLAAARAATEAGLPLATHAHLGRGGLVQLELLTGAGLPAHRICIGHQDLLDDPDVHRKLAAAGAYVAFDTIGKDGYQSDERRLRLLLALLEAGHAERVLLSCDISRHTYLRHEGGQGYGHLFRSFLPKARAVGIDDDLVDMLTRRNPLRFLTGSQGGEI
ncbi:phosphotriesterase [Streptomyces sp. NPDC059474]|uniref:phosphotriesterase family protein n=1 Tax=Streptomyces sp. NPDC059474 TaxID=3346846 RepID=UPI0036869B36